MERDREWMRREGRRTESWMKVDLHTHTQTHTHAFTNTHTDTHTHTLGDS